MPEDVPELPAVHIKPGCRVMVPLGKKHLMGVVIKTEAKLGELEEKKIKPIIEILDDDPILDLELIELLIWMSAYYLVPLGEAIRTALPSCLITRERQCVEITERGRRVLAAQEQLLLSDSDVLIEREKQLLELIVTLGGRAPVLKLQDITNVHRVISKLIQRGFASQTILREKAGRPRTDLLLHLTGAENNSQKCTPRQERLLKALEEKGGRAMFSQLAKTGINIPKQVAQKLAEKGLIHLEELEVPRDPFSAEPIAEEKEIELTEEQGVALSSLMQAMNAGEYRGFLLHGVTGSGKTEVYLRLIAEVIHQGKTALVLVPEISLTPQLAARFRSRFRDQVAVLHSGLTSAERFSQWRLIRQQKVSIVVGARSAIFAPLTRLGAVIVDEEHDPSFKQEKGVPYHARDLALLRAKRANALAVLGSATPSLESYHGVSQGRLQLLVMSHRATPMPLPEVEILDLKQYRTGPEGFLSAPLDQALQGTLERQEQAILFLNRRGFSTFVLCKACGHVFQCKHCSVSLTFHRKQNRMRCHYCGYSQALPEECPACSAKAVELLGLGTEKVEDALKERFPEARIARLDRDTAMGSGLRSILKRVSRREIDILVGTQMVTKGHDFPDVTLVGVVCADLGLHFPDFRSAERTFQLLTQVAGRAGRGKRIGRVIIQTYSPDHPSLIFTKTHNYEAFYRSEIQSRQELHYPPWGYLAAIRIDGANAQSVKTVAEMLKQKGRQILSQRQPVQLLGPAEAPIQRLKGRTRWLVLLKSTSRKSLREVLIAMLEGNLSERRWGVRVSVDVDPLMML